MRRLLAAGTAIVLTVGLGTVSTSAPGPTPSTNWIGTWATAPSAGVRGTEAGYPNYSIRNVVHTSVGGHGVRVRLSNAFGTAPLTLGRVTVAVSADPSGPRAVAGSMRELTFGGAGTTVVPAGAEVLSDPVRLRVPEDGDLLVTTYTPTPSGLVTYHPLARQTSFFTRAGDFAAEESGASFVERTKAWHYVSGVDVQGAPTSRAVATLGDSITDGFASTEGANQRWPDLLSDRMIAEGRRHGVLNAGISANRLLLDEPGDPSGRNALARLDGDALSRSGVGTLIVLEGINDIQQTPHQTDPAVIIAAYRQIIAQTHARGIRVVGGTLTPFKGWMVYDETLEATRQAVNTFIRTSGAFDAVIDFDLAVRDPADPQRLLPAYDSGDHLHPGDAGYQAMADAVDLARL
ncbi:SGNH/GDSL hydrolase family protein [Amycolatopsis nigrescens]|uniref:SGNH/GDSL hydrolase family protein n=1 Tax=Amycolatopsis nigrescens TaxID=381445 RepID=UPI0004766B8C|nr:SGNH/GDSL hydrolase family protein [Amycolatopsis nigrescens]